MPDKFTTRIVQDGMEISWERQRETPLTPEEAAKLSIEGVEALQKFKEKDPRTQPELRQQKKDREEGEKATKFRLEGVLLVCVVAWLAWLMFAGGDLRVPSLSEIHHSAAPGVNYGSRGGGCN